jgi:hypothetical protein
MDGNFSRITYTCNLGGLMETLGRAALSLASASLVFASPLAWPQTFTVPNTFAAGAPASAADVNTNFSATAAAVNGKQNLVTGTCPAGQAIRIVNPNGTVTCQSISFFGGDGSAGNLTVSVSTDWNSAPPANPNFANVTINPGQTLTVPAGTVIRCSGSFTNNGILAVSIGSEHSGTSFFTGVSGSGGAASVADAGDSRRAAVAGQMDNNTTTAALLGGPGGIGIPQAVARTAFGQFRVGGGAGGGPFDAGGGGGGLVKIYCEGPIVNLGTINALGTAASNSSVGGGGGGIVILASRTSVSNSGGTINVSGGNGGPSNTSWGGVGGGGGGGIIVMASPAAPVSGTQIVTAGSPGTSGTTLTTQTRTAGGGGGASGGSGGSGGGINSSIAGAGTGGAAGYVITMTLDPTAIAR